MKSVLVDSCVILDIVTEDPKWYSWSAEKLEEYSQKHELVINPIIYSEISIGFQKIEEVEEALPATIFKRVNLPWEACFLAGKCFYRYKKLGGHKTLPLPDFFIGAHAAIENYLLLTRDAKRFRHYYPKLHLVCPT